MRVDHPDPALAVTGLVGADRAEAWFVVATVDTPVTQSVGPVRLPGLDPERRYLVVDRTPPGPAHRAEMGETWLDGDGVVVDGRALDVVGLRFPALPPRARACCTCGRRGDQDLRSQAVALSADVAGT